MRALITKGCAGGSSCDMRDSTFFRTFMANIFPIWAPWTFLTWKTWTAHCSVIYWKRHFVWPYGIMIEHSKKTQGHYPASPWLRRFQDALFKLFQGKENSQCWELSRQQSARETSSRLTSKNLKATDLFLAENNHEWGQKPSTSLGHPG